MTLWITARQASLSITNSQSSLRLTSIESVTPSSHLILCRPLLLLPPIPPTIRVFSNESTLHMRWPKCWSFSLSISYLLVADKVATLQVVLFCCQISCCHAILCNCVTQFSQASQDCWRVPFWRFSSEFISCTAGTVFGLLLPVLSAPSFSLILIPSIQPPGSGSLYSSIVDILIPKGTAFPSAN